jgi:hypothetical protein
MRIALGNVKPDPWVDFKHLCPAPDLRLEVRFIILNARRPSHKQPANLAGSCRCRRSNVPRPCGLDGLPPQDKRQAHANRPFRPGFRHADRLAQAVLHSAPGPFLRHNQCYGITGRWITPKWIFLPFAHYSSMSWQRLLYHRTIFRPLTARIAGILKLKGNCLRRVWHALRRRRIHGRILERSPIPWNHVIEKGRPIAISWNRSLSKKFVNFSGTCSKRHGAELRFGFFAKA